MVNHVLVVFGGRPGKDEHSVSLAGLDLSRRSGADFFHRDFVHSYPGVVLLSPVPGHTFEPCVKLRHKMGPFCDPQRLLAGESAVREEEEWSDSRRTGRQSDEIPARNLPSLDPGHFDHRLPEDTTTPGRAWALPGAFLLTF